MSELNFWLVAGALIGAYLAVGCGLTLLLWHDSRYAKWTLRGTIIAVCLSPLVAVEWALGQVRGKLVREEAAKNH